MKMDLIEGSETSEIINQTPGNYPKENLLYSVHGESQKSRNFKYCTRKFLGLLFVGLICRCYKIIVGIVFLGMG